MSGQVIAKRLIIFNATCTRQFYFLLFLFLLFCITRSAAQPVKTKTTLDIENTAIFLQKIIKEKQDTTGVLHLLDSINAENNLGKSEYCRFFSFQAYCDLDNRGFTGSSCLQSLQKIVASLKTQGVKSLYKFHLGEVICSEQNFSRGIELMLEALSECKFIGYENIPHIWLPFYLMSNRYYQFGNYRKCIEFSRLADYYNNEQQMAGLHNTWGLAYQKLEVYDSAVIEFKKVLQLSNEKHDSVWTAIASGNLGRTYCLKGNYNLGIPLLLIDVQHGANKEPVNSAISALYIADAYNKMKKHDSAISYINYSKELFVRKWPWKSKEFYTSKVGYYYYQQYSQWLQLMNRFPEALQYMDTAIINEKKFNNQYDWQLLTSTEKRIEGLEYQQNIALLASQQKNERLQKILLAVVLISVVLVAALIIKRQRLKQKKERQLAKEKETNLRLKEEQTRQELEAARQQLDDFMKRVEEKAQVKENITASLKAIGSISSPGAENMTQKLAELANASLLTQADWQDFQQRFEKVYPGFFANLTITISGITPAEERLFALLKLKISYRQMASMLGISPESVRTAKYRLRKKLAATSQTELLSLLEDSPAPEKAA